MTAETFWLMFAGGLIGLVLGCVLGHKFAMYYMTRINAAWRRAVMEMSHQLTAAQGDREELGKEVNRLRDELEAYRIDSK